MSEFGPAPIEVNESFEEKEELYHNKYVDIYHPKKQAIPNEEGLQIVVDPLNDDIINKTRAMFFGIGVAKTIAEGKFNKDFWANIHENAHPGTENVIDVFGRDPQSQSAWGKPVNIKMPEERKEEPLEERQRNKLKRTLESYIPKWEKAGQRITLFDEGLHPLDPQSERFQSQRRKGMERPWPWQSYTAWMTDKYELTVVMQPHIKGIHLVLSPLHEYWANLPREDFRHPEKSPIMAWETPAKPEGSLEYLKGVVESYAILCGVKEILEQNNLSFNNEIHFSGNWGFAPLDAGPEASGRRVDEDYLNETNITAMENQRKKTKTRLERGPWMSTGGGWASHGHLYGTDSNETYVHLPSQPKSKKPDEWRDIPEYDEAQAETISQVIQENLNIWLESHNLENQKLIEG